MKTLTGIALATGLFILLPGAVRAETITTPSEAASPSTTTGNPAAASSTSPVTLRLKYKQGQVLHYRTVLDGDGTLTMGTMPTGLPIKLHLVQTMTQNVTDVRASDGAATISTHIDSLKLTVNGQDVPQPPAVALSKSGTMTISPTGEVLSITPPAESVSNPKAQAVLSGVNAIISKLTGCLPLLPVSVGEKWGQPVDLSMVGVQIAPGYTLKGLNTVNGDTVADIAFRFTGNGDSSKSLVPVPMPGKLMGRGDSNGHLLFDVGSGLITGQAAQFNIAISFIPGKKAAAMPSMIPAGPMRLQAQANLTMEKIPDTDTPQH